jgi:RNA-directed DNA polymerase
MQHVIDEQNSHEHLLERILSSETMQRAWKRVKENKGAAGVDGMSIDEMPEYLCEHWQEIRESLLEETYQPTPVLRKEIPKPTGGTRQLGVPIVLDRLIHQAIAQVVSEICDPDFSERSYGFRPGRSAHDAVYRAREYIRQSYRVAVDMDLEKFFDTVNHDVVMCRVSRKIHDKRVLRLIGKYLRAGVSIDGRLHRTPQGVPQGGPLSPVLSNVLLDELDKELEKRGHRFVRYADDFVIFVKSVRAGERVMHSIRRFLEKTLKLRVNEANSHVRPTDHLEFLGFTFKKTSIRGAERAFQEFKRRMKRLTGRSWGVSMTFRLKKLAEYVRGWMNYFGIAEYYTPIPELDHWLRRRVRMCYWKQWRKCRTKVRNLLKLGVSLKAAMSVGMSRKSFWRLSKTYATQRGRTNQWVKEQGLISIKDLWVNMHSPATAR